MLGVAGTWPAGTKSAWLPSTGSLANTGTHRLHAHYDTSSRKQNATAKARGVFGVECRALADRAAWVHRGTRGKSKVTSHTSLALILLYKLSSDTRWKLLRGISTQDAGDVGDNNDQTVR
jgi:hypothetical protein